MLLGLSLFVQGAYAVGVDDYERAERFLPWNTHSYVINASIQHHWIRNEDRFWYLRENSIGEREFVVVDAATGKKAPAFDQEKVAACLSKLTGNPISAGALPFSTFHYTQHETAIEFQIGSLQWTWQIKTGTCTRKSRPQIPLDGVLSPNGKWIAFSKDNNLWLRPTNGGNETPLTTDGAERYAYAYIPIDAISHQRHLEEMKLDLVWSPNSNFILTSRTDQRRVRNLYLIQSDPEDDKGRQRLYTFPQGVPGDKNLTAIAPLIINVRTHKLTSLDVQPLTNVWPQGVILPPAPYAWWAKGGSSVYFLKRDRFGKSLSLNALDIADMKVRELLNENSATFVKAGWGEGLSLIRTLENGDVLWYSDRDGWGHLYYYSGSTGTLRNQITKGQWVVRDIVHVDEPHRQVYFLASGREPGRDPYQKYLYVCDFDGSNFHLLTPEEADHYITPSRQASADESSIAEQSGFSQSGRYFVDSYSSYDLPPILVLRTADGRIVTQLESADISMLRAKGYTPVTPFKVLAADGKTPIYGNLFRPSTFDPTKKYPIIDATFPGPHEIRAGKTFLDAMFCPFEAQSLAELGFVVITIDGRGTPYRSRDFTDYSYGRLAMASDLADHVAGIRQLAARYPYMDLSRVGIDGVSQGGFQATRGVLAYPDFYKVAVSASGPYGYGRYRISWFFETYEGPVGEEGPEDSGDETLVGNLKGKLLLMHGDLDDRTSPSHTLMLVAALIKANKDFDLLIMPNQNHSAFLTPYFIRRKWDYFVRNLLRAEPPLGYQITKPQ